MICQLITRLEARARGLSPHGANAPLWSLLRLVRLTESLVRRWLVLKACVQGWPQGQVRGRRDGDATPIPVIPDGRLKRTDPGPRATSPDQDCKGSGISAGAISRMTGVCSVSEPSHSPLFRLAEAAPRMPIWVWQAATATSPAGWCLQYGAGGAQPTRRPIASGLNPANLIRRCTALSDVMAHPRRHVRRMARWLSRAAEQRKTGPGRAIPLRMDGPPGASQGLRRCDPTRHDMLLWLNKLARDAVVRCGGPP